MSVKEGDIDFDRGPREYWENMVAEAAARLDSRTIGKVVTRTVRRIAKEAEREVRRGTGTSAWGSINFEPHPLLYQGGEGEYNEAIYRDRTLKQFFIDALKAVARDFPGFDFTYKFEHGPRRPQYITADFTTIRVMVTRKS